MFYTVHFIYNYLHTNNLCISYNFAVHMSIYICKNGVLKYAEFNKFYKYEMMIVYRHLNMI